MMKLHLIASALASVFLVAACSIKTPTPQITAVGLLELDKKGEIELFGQGFAPHSEITLLLITTDGVQSDIGYAVTPAPVADATGNWTTTWSYGRFVKKKLVAEGDYSLIATDEDFTPLAQGTVTFKTP